MGGATRFFILLTTPFSLLHPRPCLLHLARHARLSFPSSFCHLTPSATRRRCHLLLASPIKASQHIHTQTSPSLGFSPTSHPWPEWSKLLESLTAGAYFDRQRFAAAEGYQIEAPNDDFVAVEDLSDEFLRAANACLAFAFDQPNLLGLLSRRDIEVVVENGSAFLFKSAHDSARRMRAFLGSGESNVFEFDKAHTVDLMRFLLSYASNPTVSSERDKLYNEELVESSVRNLLNELANVSYYAPESDLSESVRNQFTNRYGQNIEMKRGDWVCPRCRFMNFARNVKCLECEEARPKRQLTGGEWDCPQCNFFNYGRNMVCIRCDCKRPGEVSFHSTNSSGLGYGNGSSTGKVDVDNRFAGNEEKRERWFSKVSQQENISDLNSATPDDDFPEIMPLRKGVNRFVISTRKTPLERRLANAQYQKNFGDEGTPGINDVPTGPTNKTFDASVSQSLDEILGHTSAVSETDKKSTNLGRNAEAETPPSISSVASTRYGHPKGSNSNYVPFVPLPADMFAKKLQNSETEGIEKQVTDKYEYTASKASEQTILDSGGNKSGGSEDTLQLSQKSTSQIDSEDKEKEQDEKSERWFKRVAELHDDTDLASAVSDDDFPEIMPLRKGENRFVVSKKKDRSLTSPMYKRKMAMEQACNANFVPFVPFPPDYFAKKDKQELDVGDLSEKTTVEAPLPEKLDSGVSDKDCMEGMDNQRTSKGSWNSRSSGENLTERERGGNAIRNSDNPQINCNSLSSGYTGKENMMRSPIPTIPSENRNIKESWTGKSLEGSAVKEPDPLDMSEEAKTERWFRRIAQIKDISELSKIPDEDFPSIMPMRKGVNRFVVSKRKTPLERRLTSPQYRRNLPIVSSNPVKKENDSS